MSRGYKEPEFHNLSRIRIPKTTWNRLVAKAAPLHRTGIQQILWLVDQFVGTHEEKTHEREQHIRP